jgi:hypothetical protein
MIHYTSMILCLKSILFASVFCEAQVYTTILNAQSLNTHCTYFQRGRVEDVVVSDECRGKQLGKL